MKDQFQGWSEHPLDVDKILRKRRSIRRMLLEEDGLAEIRVAVLGGSTTAEIIQVLELFLLKLGLQPVFYESEYDFYYQDAVFGNDALDSFAPDIIYVHTSAKNLRFDSRRSIGVEEFQEELGNEIGRFEEIWSKLERFDCAIIQNNFEPPHLRILGNLDAYSLQGQVHFTNQLNLLISESARKRPNLYINDINYLASMIGLTEWYDHRMWNEFKYAMSYDAIPELAKNIASVVQAILGRSRKCLVLDLDNTLWGGVIGDDGLNNISIGNGDGTSEAYLDFQRYVQMMQQRGVSLAVCSKNDAETASEGLGHQESILSADDFAAFKANWNNKDHNIREISTEMNIGLESLVFIDDNPVEREIVKSQVDGVAVPDVGSDVRDFATHVDRNGFFETVSISKDDIHRNKYYTDNTKRKEASQKFEDYSSFLMSLEMSGTIEPFADANIDRITQLTNKTNQFNLTTKRFTVADIEKFSKNSSYVTLSGRLTDKFGDNGLVSVVAGEKKGDECHIFLWLMSCRVLKRDMELAMFNSLVEESRKRGVKKIVGYFSSTAKNDMVSSHYMDLGFTEVSSEVEEAVFTYSIDQHKSLKHHIAINND